MSEHSPTAVAGAGVCKVPLMNPAPEDAIHRESPLQQAGLSNVGSAGAKPGAIVFREQPFPGLLSLRIDAGSASRVHAVEKVLGLPLPTAPLTATAQSTVVVRWLSPDEWLISVPRPELFDLEMRFREQVPGHCALINVSSAHAVWTLSGGGVTDLLKKCVPVDVHPRVFPIGKVVSTQFAKSGATLRRASDSSFELIVRRSFAHYAWLWVQDASREFGLIVEA